MERFENEPRKNGPFSALHLQREDKEVKDIKAKVTKEQMENIGQQPKVGLQPCLIYLGISNTRISFEPLSPLRTWLPR